MTQAYYGASNATTSCGYEVYIGGPSCPPSIQPPSNVCQHSFSSIECPMQEPPVHRPIVPRVTVHSDILPAIDSDRAVLPLLGASQLSTQNQLKWRMTYGRAMVRIVGELSKVQKTYPIVLLGVDVMLEILFKHAIDSLCLPVEGSGEVQLSPHHHKEHHPEKPGEA